MTTMDVDPLLEMIRTLRGPQGCPWDRKQRLEDLRPFLIEEAHEAAAALDLVTESQPGKDRQAAARELAGELGDLLFQLCFVVELAQAEGLLQAQDIVDGVHQKMIERHPHVYGDETLTTAEDVARAWEQRKAKADPARSILAGVPTSLPALTGAFRIGQKAAGVGFDWREPAQVRSKVDEELAEVDQAIKEGDREAAEEELGDLLLTVASLARHLEIEPERALAKANAKFRRRFQRIEGRLAGLDLEAAEALWQEAKLQDQ